MEEDSKYERITGRIANIPLLAFEASAWSGHRTRAPFADLALVIHLRGDVAKQEVCLALDADETAIQRDPNVMSRAAKTIGNAMEMSVSIVPASSELGRSVSSSGTRVYNARDHKHTVEVALPAGETTETWSSEIIRAIDAAGHDPLELYRATVRAVDFGYFAVAYNASQHLLSVDAYKERAATVRMLALNKFCLHEAAEARGQEYLRTEGESPSILVHLANALAFQDRDAEAIAVAERVVELDELMPGSVASILKTTATGLIGQLRKAPVAPAL